MARSSNLFQFDDRLSQRLNEGGRGAGGCEKTVGLSQQGEPSTANHLSPGAPRTWDPCPLPKETMLRSREAGQARGSGGFSQVVAMVEVEPWV